MSIAPEGYPFITISALLTIPPLVIDGYLWLAVIPLFVTFFMLFFFRDPDRKIPQKEGILVSPADGKVIVCSETYEKDFLQSRCKMISIFMSPLDVHVNRMPCDCRIVDVVHKKGRFMAAFKPEATVENESISVVLETTYGKILLRQVAGFVARRAVCRGQAGDTFRMGDRFGIIKFSSRVDIYFPLALKETVSLDDKVKAGETIIAEIK
ncbi:MAG: phosphatidylserine decarboxylase family protein [Thermodesulfovibrionales bacterium]|nr:phosphatidylserine decarboxylase family protein [Thermodesulfovibrionales bacterium]